MGLYSYPILVIGWTLSALVCLEHIYIFILEGFLWRSRGPKAFRVSQSYADATGSLAANQGFYNAILAAGVLYGIIRSIYNESEENISFLSFFLVSISAAGVFGSFTASFRILFIQTIPSFFALIVIQVGYSGSSCWQWLVAGFVTLILTALVAHPIGKREANYKHLSTESRPLLNTQDQ